MVTQWEFSMSYTIRDRQKFGFGFSFGAEYNNLNCFGKFRFWPNIDLRLLAKIRFPPKKFDGFRRSAVNDIRDRPDWTTA